MLHSITDFFYLAKNLIYEETKKFMIDRIKDLSINDFIKEIDEVNELTQKLNDYNKGVVDAIINGLIKLQKNDYPIEKKA